MNGFREEDLYDYQIHPEMSDIELKEGDVLAQIKDVLEGKNK